MSCHCLPNNLSCNISIHTEKGDERLCPLGLSFQVHASLALHGPNTWVNLEAFWAASGGGKGEGKAVSSSPPLALLPWFIGRFVCLSRLVWSGRKHSWAAGPGHPSITVNKWNGGPLHHFIYYCNDYIDHCPPIVSVIDLINFQLITEGDI